MADVRTMKLNLLADVGNFSKGLVTADEDTTKFSKKVLDRSKKMAKAFALVGAAAGAMAIKLGVDAAKAASDMSEEISKANVIFGEGAKEIEQFSATAAKSLGLSKKEALSANSTFAILGKGAGLTGRDLTKFSKSATTLAADLGSFFNTNADEAITAIGAALRGESEPIRKYGVLLNDATIKAKAMEMGLYDGKGALDVQAKSLAAYEVILEQTTDAQGDFARTSDGAAGQMKIFRAEMDNLKVTFGNNLLPIMTTVVTFANDKLIPVIKNIADGFSGNRGGLSERAIELGASLDSRTGYSLGESIRALADAFGNLFQTFTDDGDETTTNMTNLANSLQTIANAITAISNAYAGAKEALNYIDRSGSFNNFGGFKGLPNPLSKPKTKKARAAGGGVMQAYRVGEFGPEMFVPSGSGSIRKDTGGGGSTIININGVIDAESARRSIEKLLQNSARRTSPINLIGATL
jgi:uncharacterized protein YukE